MDQQVAPEDRRVFQRVLAARVKYDRETADDDREKQASSHLRKLRLPAVRQTQFDKTGSRQPLVINIPFYPQITQIIFCVICGWIFNYSSKPGLTNPRAAGKPFSKR